MKRFSLIFVILLILVGSILILFIDYSLSFYDVYDLSSANKIDAVVVLTGGKGRLSKAIKIFSEIDSKTLFISGAGESSSIESIFSKEDLAQVDPMKIVLEKDSKSTYENAVHAKQYVLEHQVASFVLVTSNYPMKRALLIFQKTFPDNIDVIPYAIESDNFNLESWWKTPLGLKLAFLEFTKYYWYWFTL